MPLHPTQYTTSHKHGGGVAAPVALACPVSIPRFPPFFPGNHISISVQKTTLLQPKSICFREPNSTPWFQIWAHDLGWANQHKPFPWHKWLVHNCHMTQARPMRFSAENLASITQEMSSLFLCRFLGPVSFTRHLVITRGGAAQEGATQIQAGLRDTEPVTKS